MKSCSIADIIPELKPLVGYHVGVFEDTPDPNVEWPHRHSFFSLVWFTNGSGINVIDFNEYEIIPNRIFMINPKQIHNWNYSIDCKGYFLLIEEHLVEHLQLDFTFPFLDIPADDRVFVKEIITRMISNNNQETAIKYLFSILNTSENLSNERDNGTIVEFKKIITENYSLNLAIEQYAESLNISPEILNGICKRKTGLTAKQLQLDLKVTEAKRLLLYSSLNISEIAFNLGFEDSSYFSRIFKKKTGFTPNSFQEKYLNKKRMS